MKVGKSSDHLYSAVQQEGNISRRLFQFHIYDHAADIHTIVAEYNIQSMFKQCKSIGSLDKLLISLKSVVIWGQIYQASGILACCYSLVCFSQLAKSGVKKKMWDQMQEFVDMGHSYVLSTNHSEHVEKMKTSRYAYMIDLTSLHIESMGDCSLKILPESLSEPMRYSIALQNSSAYAELIGRT